MSTILDKEGCYYYYSSPQQNNNRKEEDEKAPYYYRYFKPLALAENGEPLDGNFRVKGIDWIYFIFEDDDDDDDGEMIYYISLYCRLKGGDDDDDVYVYYKICQNLFETKYYSAWYTNNPNAFIDEIKKKEKDIKNSDQSILDLFKQSGITVKSAVNCTGCLVELIISNIFARHMTMI